MENIKGHELNGDVYCQWCLGAGDVKRAQYFGRMVIPISQSERPGCECDNCGWILDANGAIPKD